MLPKIFKFDNTTSGWIETACGRQIDNSIESSRAIIMEFRKFIDFIAAVYD